jgi:hypothetical protein
MEWNRLIVFNENYKAWTEINRDSENFHDPYL